MSKGKGRNRLQHALWAGFGAILLLLVVSWAVQLSQVNQFFELIQRSRLASDKMDIITGLIEVARSRTRMTVQMIALDDPFEKDAIRMQLDAQAGAFASLRQQLMSSGLTSEEQALLEQNGSYVQPALKAQRQAADMALSDDPVVLREANHIMMFEVFPLQGKIIDNFMVLFQRQRQIIHDNTLRAQTLFDQVVFLLTTLTVGILLLAITVALLVIRKTAQTERALHREKERAQVTLGSIGDAVIATDALGRVEYMNATAERLTGYPLAQVVNSPIGKVFQARDESCGRRIAEFVQSLGQYGEPGRPSDDVLLRNAHGDELHIALTLEPIREQGGRVEGVILSFQDVTEARRLARRVAFHAQHDALTGLLNRRAFEERVNQALALYDDAQHVMCAMDLDRFKVVNDSCGHAAGDELLRQLSLRIRTVVRQGDLVARMGGDEFALFLLNTNARAAKKLAEQVLTVVRDFRFLWEGKTFRVGASIGLVESHGGAAVDFAQLLQGADAGCYQAKNDGRDRLVVVSYDSETVAQQRKEGEWISRISDAFDNDGLVLEGQPIVHLGDDAQAPGFVEVLVRMRGEGGELVPPMSFLPAAERSNLIARIDEWVLSQVLGLIAGDAGGALRFSINLSGQSMGDPGFLERVTTLIEASDVDPRRLCFELTETAALANLEVAQQFMARVRSLGCLVALDDFGSGLSSFAYIKNLPVDIIKIDGDFVLQLLQDKTSRVMVEAIHGIARSLGLRTVAEFVEDAAVLRLLTEIGIDMAQGYHIGRPQLLELGRFGSSA